MLSKESTWQGQGPEGRGPRLWKGLLRRISWLPDAWFGISERGGQGQETRHHIGVPQPAAPQPWQVHLLHRRGMRPGRWISPGRPVCARLPDQPAWAYRVAGYRPRPTATSSPLPHRHRKGGRARHLQRAHLSGELIVLDGEMHRVTARRREMGLKGPCPEPERQQADPRPGRPRRGLHGTPTSLRPRWARSRAPDIGIPGSPLLRNNALIETDGRRYRSAALFRK
jgi:hypothetical protein